MPLKIGTSGWQYRDWRGGLYPETVPQRRWLEHYARYYLTVENNNSFYRLPPRETFESWRERTPDDFVMTVKASRYLTHVRRLRDPAGPVARLLGAASGLGPKLGPVLLQLPPTLKADPDLLDACLKEFRTAAAAAGGQAPRLAVEPRHETWWTDEVRQVLTAHDAALCLADRRGRPVAPLWRTATWGYLRFHEGTARPWPRYGPQALRTWVARLSENWPDEADVYVYFNNDQGGAAVVNSGQFARLAREAGRSVTRTPLGRVYGRPMEVAELAHLRRARDLLDREYARPLDVPAMARAALMSPSLFSRRFREAYGETPYAYLQARRVERAMALLRDGGMSVTDACMAVGFTSLGSFSSTFARLIGEPPSAYRARDHSRLAPVPPCMTRAWARPGWIAEPCRIGEALPARPA